MCALRCFMQAGAWFISLGLGKDACLFSHGLTRTTPPEPQLLDAHLSRPVYKHVLGVPITHHDLEVSETKRERERGGGTQLGFAMPCLACVLSVGWMDV